MRRIAYLHSAKAPTWRYYLTYIGANAGTGTGAGHGRKVSFVLETVEGCNCLGRLITPLDRALEHRSSDRWAEFVSNRRPSGEIVWSQDDRRHGRVLEIADLETIHPGFMAARFNVHITALNFAGRRSTKDK